jgi:O-antigen/teichoic acid export membrane protein
MSARDGPSRDQQDTENQPDSIARNTAFAYATRLSTAALTAGLTLFLVRALGPDEYGLYAIALGIGVIAGNVADAGISNSAARFVAEAHRSPAVGPLIVDSVKLKVIVTGAICVLFGLLASPIANAYDEPGLVWPLRAMAIATFGQSLVYLLLMVVTGFGRIAVNLRLATIESVLEVSASITLVLLGGGAAGAAFGRAIGFVLGGIIGLVLVYRLIGRPDLRLRHGPSRSTARRVGAYARSLLVVDTAYSLSGNISVLLLGAYAGSAASGIFHAPLKLVTFLQYVGVSAAYGVGPRLARRAGQEPDVHALGRGLRGLIVFQCALIAPMVIWADPITHVLLGGAYAEAGGVLAALAPYIFLAGLTPLLSISVNYLGEARRRIPIAIATLAIVAGLGVLLIPDHGPVGAAIASDIGFGFYTLGHVWLCRRLLLLPLAPLAWALACGMTAAGAMAIVLLSVGDHLTPAEWLVGGVGGLAVYVGVLMVMRQLHLGDLARAAGAVRARLARRAARSAAPGPAQEPAAARTVQPTHEIIWSSRGDTGVFRLQPLPSDNGGGRANAEPKASPPVPWGWRLPPAPLPPIREAHRRLVRELLDSGWKQAGEGEEWFAERFARV